MVLTINVVNIERHASNGQVWERKLLNRVTFHRSFTQHVPLDLGSHANTEFNDLVLSALRRRDLKMQAFFLRLGLPSILIQTENGSFRKHSSNRRNLKTSARCVLIGKHFEKELFENRSLCLDFYPSPFQKNPPDRRLWKPWHLDNHVINRNPSFSLWPVIFAFSNSSGVVGTCNFCVNNSPLPLTLVTLLKFFSCSTNIPRGLSAFKP